MRLKAHSIKAAVDRRWYPFSVSLDTPSFLVRKDGFLFLWGLGSLGWQVAQSSHSFPSPYYMFRSVSCFHVCFSPAHGPEVDVGTEHPPPGKDPQAHIIAEGLSSNFPLGAALSQVKAMGSSFSHFPMFLCIIWPMSFLWSG